MGKLSYVPVVNPNICWDGTYEPYQFFVRRHSDSTVPLKKPAWGTQSPEVNIGKENRGQLVSKNTGTDRDAPAPRPTTARETSKTHHSRNSGE